VSILRNLGLAWRLFVRQVRWHLGEPVAPERVPAYMLRCQHCPASIRLISTAAPVPEATSVFIDAEGHMLCPTDERLLHRPMPSVLG
jgi:MarR-like DNA-binding transcriptional regulator SgrR of sgrS sRNA